MERALSVSSYATNSFSMDEGVIGVECPACGLKGTLSGWYKNESEPEIEYRDEYGYQYHEFITVEYIGEHFSCGACGLSLDGPRELEAAESYPVFRRDVQREPVYEEEYGND